MKLVLSRWKQSPKDRARIIRIESVFFRREVIGYTYLRKPSLGMFWKKAYLKNYYDLVYVMFDSFEQASMYGQRDPLWIIVPERGKLNETYSC